MVQFDCVRSFSFQPSPAIKWILQHTACSVSWATFSHDVPSYLRPLTTIYNHKNTITTTTTTEQIVHNECFVYILTYLLILVYIIMLHRSVCFSSNRIFDACALSVMFLYAVERFRVFFAWRISPVHRRVARWRCSRSAAVLTTATTNDITCSSYIIRASVIGCSALSRDSRRHLVESFVVLTWIRS